MTLFLFQKGQNHELGLCHFAHMSCIKAGPNYCLVRECLTLYTKAGVKFYCNYPFVTWSAGPLCLESYSVIYILVFEIFFPLIQR